VVVADNNSSDDTVLIIERDFGATVRLVKNKSNLGYAAAHNQGFFLAKKEGFDFILILNPDAFLSPGFIDSALRSFEKHPSYSIFTPKIYRTDMIMRPYDPPIIDAAGMMLNSWARHFDRGSDIFDREQYDQECEVFGGTGAALFLRMRDIDRMTLLGRKRDKDKYSIYPQLKDGEDSRLPVFDEAFFAFREDAELAWRARNIGLRTLYIPQAIAYHRRTVTHDRREFVDPKINSWSVRNRFLMQIVNFRMFGNLGMFLPGIMLWNLVVILMVFIKERTSITGLWEACLLTPRAIERRWLAKAA
jgi:GT2 family glycosyltransferase